jgi:hypothetical protein
VEYRCTVSSLGASGSSAGYGFTYFGVLENPSAVQWYNTDIEGLMLAVNHHSVNLTDERCYVDVYSKTAGNTSGNGTKLGTFVVDAIEDFTFVISLDSTSWTVSVEGANYWGQSGFTLTGVSGFDFDTRWTDGSAIRIEDTTTNTILVGPTEIDSVSISAVPEPASIGLFIVGTAGTLFLRSRFSN